MIVAVASGKGGTGKTTVAVALALSAPGPVQLLDCDVEEPNCRIFLRPVIERQEKVGIPIPVVDEAKCTACGECSALCQWHAIVSLKTQPLVFPELCHGCGGCARVCPEGAITEVEQEIGTVEVGARDGVRFVEGRLGVGHPMSPPLIRAVKRQALGKARPSSTVRPAPPAPSSRRCAAATTWSWSPSRRRSACTI